MKLLVRAALLVICVVGMATAQQRSITTRADLNTFTRNYYLYPQPELVPEAIAALGPSGFLNNANSIPPTVAFFAEIFGANPDRMPAWKELIGKQDAKVREALDASVEIGTDPGVLSFTDRAPWMNDMCWGAFFASGRPEMLIRLIETTALWEEREDKNLFLTGATALWSLAGNARTHLPVKAALQAAMAAAKDENTRARLTLALTDVALVLDGLRAVMKEQADLGKW